MSQSSWQGQQGSYHAHGGPGPQYGPGGYNSGTYGPSAPSGPLGPGGYNSGGPGGWAPFPGAPTPRQIPVGWMILGLLVRAGIAGLAWWAFFSVMWGMPGEYLADVLGQFSILQVLLAAIVTTLAVLRPILPAETRQRRFEGRHAWARGASTLYSVMTLLVFGFMMGGFGDTRLNWNVMHFVVPGLLVLDFLLFGQNQERLPWWMPFAWLLPMFGYLGWAYLRSTEGMPIYNFLDHTDSDFWPLIGMFLGAWLVVGFLLLLLGRLRGAIRRGSTGASPGAGQPVFGSAPGPFTGPTAGSPFAPPHSVPAGPPPQPATVYGAPAPRQGIFGQPAPGQPMISQPMTDPQQPTQFGKSVFGAPQQMDGPPVSPPIGTPPPGGPQSRPQHPTTNQGW